jgi:type 1 glutamine amidotransferase
MNLTPKLLALGLALLGCSLAPLNAAPIRALYFTKSSGYEHSAIKRVNGAPSYSENVFSKIGPENGIEFTFSKDGSKFSPEYLAGFDVIVFYTSGDLTAVGTDGQPAMTPEGKQALLDAVSGGKGFLAIHSGTDTFHTNEHGGGNNPIRGPRFQNYGEAADPYIKMVGGEFIKHGPQQVATAHIVSSDFPGFDKIGSELTVKEEWYSTKEFAANDRVLLVLDTKGMQGPEYDRPSYPLAWAHTYGKGRAAGNAMGHREDVWDNPAFQSMIIGQIKWAAGAVKADVTPNLDKVAPGHATLPKAPVEPVK